MIPLSGRCSCGFQTTILPGEDDLVIEYFGCSTCRDLIPFSETIGQDGIVAALKA